LISQVKQVNVLKSQLETLQKAEPEAKQLALIDMGIKPQASPLPTKRFNALSSIVAVNPFGRRRSSNDNYKFFQYIPPLP
jgi:hypothetical protein